MCRIVIRPKYVIVHLSRRKLSYLMSEKASALHGSMTDVDPLAIDYECSSSEHVKGLYEIIGYQIEKDLSFKDESAVSAFTYEDLTVSSKINSVCFS